MIDKERLQESVKQMSSQELLEDLVFWKESSLSWEKAPKLNAEVAQLVDSALADNEETIKVLSEELCRRTGLTP